MKKLSLVIFICALSFSSAALADEGWGARWSNLVTRAKNQAKKIEVKVRTWANNLFEKKDEKKDETKTQVGQTGQNRGPANDVSTATAAVTSPPTTSTSAAEVKPSPAPVRESIVESEDRGTTSEQLKAMVRQAKETKPMAVEAGRKGDSTLTRNKSGVVVIGKIKKEIPRLDIGTEDKISARDIVGEKVDFKAIKLKPFKALASPDLVDRKKSEANIPKVIEKVADAKAVVSKIKTGDFPVTKEKIDAVNYALAQPNEIIEKESKPLSEPELIMIASYMINDDNKSCHNMVGLLQSVKDKSQYAAEAKYLAGKCEKEMGLYAQYVDDMRAVIKNEDDEYGKLAMTSIADNVKFAFEDDVAEIVRAGKEKFKDLTASTYDAISFLLAKVSAHDGNAESALNHAKKVSEKSEYYTRAQFIVFSSEVLLGNNKDSIETGKNLIAYLNKKGDPHKIEALVHLNMGRTYYNSKQYAEASQSFLKIKKDHPQWVQGLIEQGWAQLQSNDPAGAIGNMFSVQTNIFAKVYKPESFAVRTIGYINLCQYGDAFQSINLFERIHGGWSQAISKYITEHKSPAKYYDTVKLHLLNQNLISVDGLPMQVVREMARHRDFINAQNAVNEMVDEVEQWRFVENFFARDLNRIGTKIANLKNESRTLTAKLTKTPNTKGELQLSPIEVNEMKSQLAAVNRRLGSLEFRVEMVKKAQSNFRDLKSKGVTLAVNKKNDQRSRAEKVLVKRLKAVKEELDEIFANNELLKYEVYAGSGENIRFEVAGGEKGAATKPKHVKDTQKNMNWNFDGEIWEDEIGNFRSSLENNCPKDKKKSASL
ncbi:MAG: hypothetical protein A4S09_04415 [Proteobacteria bacterium SG_bin7]|nr:MAG: hypothetical protein A4S09_04415 [Proteobacteria bacterium SG_bin7]